MLANNAKVAVHGLHGIECHARGTRASQRGRHLLGDVQIFADPGDDEAPVLRQDAQQEPHRGHEALA